MANFTYQDLLKRTNRSPLLGKLVSHLALDGLLVLGCLNLVNEKTVLEWIVFQCMVAMLTFRSFALMHDAVHGAAIKTLILNNVIGIVAGTFCFLPFFAWRKIHLQHHIWAGNIEKDPSMKIVNDFYLNPSKQRRILNLAWKHWIPLLALMQHFVFWTTAFKQFQHLHSKKDYFYMAASYIVPAIVYYHAAPIILRSIPGLVAYLYLVEIINFPHHLQLPQFRGETKLPPAKQFKVSRSCDYPYFFSHYFINNFNYHVEHHLFPTVPWYHLRELQTLTKSLVGPEYKESKGNSWILENRAKPIQEVILFEKFDKKNEAA